MGNAFEIGGISQNQGLTFGKTGILLVGGGELDWKANLLIGGWVWVGNYATGIVRSKLRLGLVEKKQKD